MPQEQKIIATLPDTTISLDISKSEENVIIDKQWLNVTENSGLTIYAQYHQSEIEQNKKIYNTARHVIWVGFGVIVLGIVLAMFGQTTTAILTTIAGCVSQFISGIVMAFLTHSSKSKLEYYKQLSYDEECNKYIKTIMQLSDDKKTGLLTKLIDNYCKRRK